jgi:predicted small lipoprotein YifL
MSLAPLPRTILAIAASLILAGPLAGCGQKGPLYIPHTPAAAQRATLPQTVFGGGGQPPAAPASRASAPVPPPPLPDLPDIQ